MQETRRLIASRVSRLRIKRNHGLKIMRDYFLEVKCNHRLNHFLCGNAIAERSCFGIAS